jgi:hypothetical protein
VEFGQCLRKAYDDCKVVEILNKFTNFTDTVKPLLNTANTTYGANHFSDFRYILKKVINNVLSCFSFLTMSLVYTYGFWNQLLDFSYISLRLVQ